MIPVSPLVGVALGAAAGLATWRLRLLSIVGSCIAAALGAVAMMAGIPWAMLLLAFFIPATALSRWRRRIKVQRTAGVLAEEPMRRASQVVANGGLFGAAAIAALGGAAEWPVVVAIGALAAAAADTWATEIGMGMGGAPWSLRSRTRVAPGTSGAVTLPGTVAMCLGAAWMGTSAALAGFDPAAAMAGAVGGVGGALGDTLLGATVQYRRWCPACERGTEREVHDCGTPTRGDGGWRFMSNDVVNVLSTLIGAAVAVGWHRAFA